MIEWFKKYDILTKSLCLIFSMVLWFYITNAQNRPIETTLHDIEVEFRGEEQMLESYGLVMVSGEDGRANVKIRGARDRLVETTPEKVVLYSELTKIDKEGQFELPVQAETRISGVDVIERLPDFIPVTIEKVEEISIPVYLQIGGVDKKDKLYDVYTLVPDKVLIKGPKSELNLIKYAVVNINSEDLKSLSGNNIEYDLVDAQGKEVEIKYTNKVNKYVYIEKNGL